MDHVSETFSDIELGKPSASASKYFIFDANCSIPIASRAQNVNYRWFLFIGSAECPAFRANRVHRAITQKST